MHISSGSNAQVKKKARGGKRGRVLAWAADPEGGAIIEVVWKTKMDGGGSGGRGQGGKEGRGSRGTGNRTLTSRPGTTGYQHPQAAKSSQIY
jgi:hypothetical protein